VDLKENTALQQTALVFDGVLNPLTWNCAVIWASVQISTQWCTYLGLVTGTEIHCQCFLQKENIAVL